MHQPINARIRLGLVVSPLWGLVACGGGETVSTGAPAPTPAPAPSPGAAPAPAPLPTSAQAIVEASPLAFGSVNQAARVAVDATGNALVVWGMAVSSTGNRQVHALRYDHASNTWQSSTTRLDSSTNSNDCYAAKIVMDASGNAMVVWTQQPGGCYARRYDAATQTWGTVHTLAASADDVTLAGNRGNVAVAVWHNGSGLHSSAYSFSGDTWSASSTITASGNHPDVGMDSSGRATLAWFRNDSGFKIYASQYTAASGWSGEVRLDANYVSDYPRVAVSPTGNTIVCWEGSVNVMGAGNEVWASAFSASSSAWSSAGIISTVRAGNTDDIAVAMDADAKGMAMWHSSGRLYAARYNAGTWASETEMDADGWQPALVMNSLAQAAAIWPSWTTSVLYGRAQTDAAQPWSAVTLAQIGSTESSAPVGALSPSGHVVAYAWLQKVSGNYRVMTRIVR